MLCRVTQGNMYYLQRVAAAYQTTIVLLIRWQVLGLRTSSGVIFTILFY